MPRLKARFGRLKAFSSRVLFHPALGKALARAYRNRIPSRGCVFDVNSPLISDRIKAALWWGRFETADWRFLKAYWRKDLDTLQLGGGIGVIASHVGRILSPGRLLVCVEANPLLMGVLEGNVTRNAPHIRKAFVNRAIDYSGAGTVEFNVAEEFLFTSLSRRERGQVCSAPTARLSELVKQHMAGEFQLQMDIEGAEAGVFLREPPQVFSRCHQVLTELHSTVYDGRRWSVENLLAAARDIHGLQMVDRYGPVVLLRPSKHS